MRALDGPAEGVQLSLRRCPVFLRLVRDRRAGVRSWDALDLPDDEPRESEEIHVYWIVPGTWMQMFVRPGGRYESGDYRHVPDAPVDFLRERDAWRAWCLRQARDLDISAYHPDDLPGGLGRLVDRASDDLTPIAERGL